MIGMKQCLREIISLTGDPKLCPTSCANVRMEILGGTGEP